MTKLTQSQENFCLEIVKGVSPADAYNVAYPKNKGNMRSKQNMASALGLNPKVIKRVNDLRRKTEEGAILTAIEIQEKFTSIILDPESKVQEKINALKELGRIKGMYEIKIKQEVKMEFDLQEASRLIAESKARLK